jgi:acetylornithine/succinyldiaminopimelate/putrescine aminotransferase|tara:strand:+ start:559 stop:759 length:201 start_codon:yes stop_codon:yes gene_type:complete
MKRYVGTAKRDGVENKRPRWILKVTDTETNEVVEETVFLHSSGESAIARAFELAREWRKKDESNSS